MLFLRERRACAEDAPFRQPPTPQGKPRANDMTEPKQNKATDAAGHGKRPLHTRFRNGKSGNPAGRPPSAARSCAKQLTDGEIFEIP
jgi:hypothetical protein